MLSKLAVFRDKEIRKTMHLGEWWFSLVDVVEVLIDSVDVRQEIKRMRQRDPELNWSIICIPLVLMSPDGKNRKTNCINIESIFRIIQSIPSSKAEPFKRWLAKVGCERVREIEDPELALARIQALYRAKGYSESWIEKRMYGIAVRDALITEWKNREVKGESEYEILTAEISKAAFGMTPSEYMTFKGLEQENLRDHMTGLELIFSMLGDAATTEIARKNDARGFVENKVAARKGGGIAGGARGKLEVEIGSKVSISENFLDEPESRKHLTRKPS